MQAQEALKLTLTFCFWEARFFSSEIFSGLYLMSDGMDTWTGTWAVGSKGLLKLLMLGLIRSHSGDHTEVGTATGSLFANWHCPVWVWQRVIWELGGRVHGPPWGCICHVVPYRHQRKQGEWQVPGSLEVSELQQTERPLAHVELNKEAGCGSLTGADGADGNMPDCNRWLKPTANHLQVLQYDPLDGQTLERGLFLWQVRIHRGDLLWMGPFWGVGIAMVHLPALQSVRICRAPISWESAVNGGTAVCRKCRSAGDRRSAETWRLFAMKSFLCACSQFTNLGYPNIQPYGLEQVMNLGIFWIGLFHWF